MRQNVTLPFQTFSPQLNALKISWRQPAQFKSCHTDKHPNLHTNILQIQAIPSATHCQCSAGKTLEARQWVLSSIIRHMVHVHFT